MDQTAGIIPIYDKAYHQLDFLLDGQDIDIVFDDTCKGIALSSPQNGNTGPGVLYDHDQTLDYFERHCDQEEFSHRLAGMTKDQQRTYLKFRYFLNDPSSVIYLRRPSSHFNQHLAGESQWTKDSQNFPKLLQLISSLPFIEVGRVVLFLQASHRPVLVHSDYGIVYNDEKMKPEADYRERLPEFLWIDLQMKKKFFLYDSESKAKIYLKSRCCYFHSRNFHGADPQPFDTFSVRVDGVFTEAFRKSFLK